MQILVKFKEDDTGWHRLGEAGGVRLMPSPHEEDGGQSMFTFIFEDINSAIHPIKPGETVIHLSTFLSRLSKEVADIEELRLIQRQPSPYWCSFGVRNVVVYETHQMDNHGRSKSTLLLSQVASADHQIDMLRKSLQELFNIMNSKQAIRIK